jgi:hypothetical protein
MLAFFIFAVCKVVYFKVSVKTGKNFFTDKIKIIFSSK